MIIRSTIFRSILSPKGAILLRHWRLFEFRWKFIAIFSSFWLRWIFFGRRFSRKIFLLFKFVIVMRFKMSSILFSVFICSLLVLKSIWLSYFWVSQICIMIFSLRLIGKDIVGVNNLVKHLFSFCVRWRIHSIEFLSGWYLRAISLYAFLIYWLLAVLCTPKT